MILTLLLNAVFHHALFIIPQQEIPGILPAAYVMRHPHNGNVEVNFTFHSFKPILNKTQPGVVESMPFQRMPRTRGN